MNVEKTGPMNCVEEWNPVKYKEGALFNIMHSNYGAMQCDSIQLE